MKNLLSILVVSLTVFGCSKSESPETNVLPSPNLSNAKEISSFKITIDNEIHSATIINDSVFYKFPSNTDLTSLKPTITVSEKATLVPPSGQVMDFTNPVKYTLTAEDKSRKEYQAVFDRYTSENSITSIMFQNVGSYTFRNYANDPKNIDTLAYEFSYVADLKDLQVQIEVSEGATLQPDPVAISDYTNPVKFTITAEDGSVNEILIMATNKELNKVDIEGFVYNEFYDVPFGGDITFSVNELNPYRDSIKVRLYSELESFDLEIKDINADTKEITATLPNTYTNNSFRLEVSIEHDNVDLSDGFNLLKGKLNFIEVKDYYNNGNPIPIETALWPGQYLNVLVYLLDDAVDEHTFFLLKNGIYYELEKKGTFNSPIGSGVKLVMPDLPQTLPESGNDYKIVVRNTLSEESFDLTNSLGNKIDVIVGQEPVISYITPTTLQKNQSLTVIGSNLFLGPVQGLTSSALTRKSQLLLKSGGRGVYVHSDTVDADGNLVFDLSSNPALQSGIWEVKYSSNVQVFPEVDTGILVTLTQPQSEHPTLQVSNAKLYGNNHPNFAKQILLSFNENIDNYQIERIVTGRQEAIIIENYFFYPTTVLTGALTNEDYDLAKNDRDGYVVINDNGIEYKIYFALQLEF